MSPFQCLYGRDPVMSPSKVQIETPEAESMATLLEKQREEAQAALRLAKERMTTGQKDEVPKKFNVGDKVCILAKNIRLKSSSPKLTNKRIGPFPIKTKLSDWAYEVELPETLRIHPVFYVGLLSRAIEDKHHPFLDQPPPETIEGEEEYEIKAIVDHKREKGTWWYYVKWKGYGPESNTWEPKENLEHAQKILKNFHSKLLKKARRLRQGP
ncbi:Transposon Tf2-1 polyprotein, putative, partial [Rhizoctonia solani AG-3 Rhs1AP]